MAITASIDFTNQVSYPIACKQQPGNISFISSVLPVRRPKKNARNIASWANHKSVL